MSDLKIYDDYNTLPEQVQLNKDDIKTLNAKIDTITNSIANLGWELKTNTSGDKSYIPKNFDENIPYSLTNITDSTQASGLNTYKDSDGYIWSYLTIYIPSDDDFVGIWTGHNNTNGYFCSLSMGVPNDKTTYLVVTYIANSDCPQSLNNDTYKEDLTIATMGWVNKYYLSKTDASNIYTTKSAIKTLEYDYFDAVLTTVGLAKIQANATIGTSITLFKDTDFTEDIYNIDLKHKTVIFNLYKNDNVYISTNIKLDIGRTTSYYSDNDQPCTWYTGIGVIKLGPAAIFGSGYLCYIAYDATYNNGLIITPIKKLS
jgi:hypothetical protein|nr:MAG TPA: hypothetical protein [Caudoviricetes sp.]